MPEISKSVGKNGQNNIGDTKIVQKLLNNFIHALGLPALIEDGDCGAKTITAITKFQSQMMGFPNPDGRVDPGGRTLAALTAAPNNQQSVNRTDNLSGADWWHANQNNYKNSDEIADLIPEFRDKVQKFVNAMRSGGADVRISSTRRNPIRAYLMHYSFRVAKGEIAASAVPAQAGCSIIWDHGNAADSRRGAQEMKDLFNIAYRPSLTSRHIAGKAIDMTIYWSGTISVQDAAGRSYNLGEPRSGFINDRLHKIGASYGVIKLLSDPPHWSTDGR
ncbi:MAG: hypothetical protein HC843_13205 [Sphingomonadales bacterium]|nr:hypothetical protein [Sphingomonadales bacterium]